MFEWDETKRLRTIAVRGLDFADAIDVFDGRAAVHVPSGHTSEARFLTVARLNGKLHAVIWTWRGTKRRIISFRRARHGEERDYRLLHG